MHCRLEPVSETGTGIAMTLENHGDLTIDVLRRGNAWDLARDVFWVHHNDRQVDYRGITAFRLPPESSDYQRLEPGESITTAYDLGRHYRLDEGGAYEIWLKSPFIQTRMGDTDLLLQHDCGSLLLDLPSDHSDIGTLQQPITVLTGATCTASDIDLMTRMDVLAMKLERYSRTFNLVTSVTPSDPRMSIYRRWFGPYDYERMDLVAFSFESVIGLEDPTGLGWFYGDCRQNPPPGSGIVCTGPGNPGDVRAAAWVNNDAVGDDGILHLCDAFLGNAAALNSQIGPGLAQILLHEKIHVQGGPTFSADYAYGGAAAKALAVNNPDAAVFNGENYAFYAGDLYLTTAVLVPMLASTL